MCGKLDDRKRGLGLQVGFLGWVRLYRGLESMSAELHNPAEWFIVTAFLRSARFGLVDLPLGSSWQCRPVTSS